VHAARKQDRRLAVALLAAAVSHTPEGEEVLRGARMRMARKPSAVARELLKNFPKGKRRRKRKRKDGQGENGAGPDSGANGEATEQRDGEEKASPRPKRARRRRKASRSKDGGAPDSKAGEVDLAGADGDPVAARGDDEQVAPAVDAVGDS
jgi:hypothetical protein